MVAEKGKWVLMVVSPVAEAEEVGGESGCHCFRVKLL